MLLISLTWKGWLFFQKINNGGKTGVETEEEWEKILVYRIMFIGHYTSKHIFTKSTTNKVANCAERMR